MYTKEQEEIALKEYERLGSITAVIHRLGYPSESTMYRWYERKKAGLENRHGQIAETTVATGHHCNTPGRPRHPSAEFKYEVLHRCFELGEDVEYAQICYGIWQKSITGGGLTAPWFLFSRQGAKSQGRRYAARLALDALWTACYHPARSSSSRASRCFMFMYFLLPHCVPAT